MRIIISDKEWYYGRYVIIALIGIISIAGGAYMYIKELREGITKSFIIPGNSNSLYQEEKNSKKNDSGEKTDQIVNLDNLERNFTVSNDDIKTSQIEIKKEDASFTSSSNSVSNEMIGVAIQGAVKNPGLYWVKPTSRLQTLIELAGGPLPNAELRYINLAAPLIDGTTVVIPEKAKVVKDGKLVSVKGPTQPVEYIYPSGVQYPSTTLAEPNSIRDGEINSIQSLPSNTQSYPTLININTASQKELESLPGIGPVLANSIIEYRKNKPFQSVEELRSIPGIGPKRFEKIRELITVSP